MEQEFAIGKNIRVVQEIKDAPKELE